ncbi:MAG: right-handed parallel beta-helix repeat-containing protein [Candidatus Komeilibacteria bacterium]
MILSAGEYVMASDLAIPAGLTLKIEPGVKLCYGQFGSGWKIVIPLSSKLQAQGEANNPVDLGVNFEIYASGTGVYDAEFTYSLFRQGSITGINTPLLNFVNCTLLGITFPAPIQGQFKNSIYHTQGGMAENDFIQNLDGLTISYSSVPSAHDGVGVFWKNSLIDSNTGYPKSISPCINAGDPQSPLDPDGTRADMGAFYFNLSSAIKVPQDYASIQDALNAASEGDVVMVSNGTYQGNIQIPTGVRLMGADPANKPVISNTANTGNLITTLGNALIENFIITNQGMDRTGRCLYADNLAFAAVIGLKDCKFFNSSDNSELIAIRNPDSALYMYNVKFLNNANNAKVLSMSINRNNPNYKSWFKNCQIKNNTGIEQLFSFVGVEPFSYQKVRIAESIFEDNGTDFLIYHSSSAGLMHGDTYHLLIEKCALCGNQGQIKIESKSNLNIEKTIIYNNSPSSMLAAGQSKLKLHNSIFWQNDGLITRQDNATLNVDYTDTGECYSGPGTGNINSDPLFINTELGDYRTKWYSPCKDTGDPASSLDPDGTRADMGAFSDHPQPTVGTVSPTSIAQASRLYLAIYGSELGAETPVSIRNLGGTGPDPKITTSAANEVIYNNGNPVAIKNLISVSSDAALGKRNITLGRNNEVVINAAIEIIPRSPKPQPQPIASE